MTGAGALPELDLEGLRTGIGKEYEAVAGNPAPRPSGPSGSTSALERIDRFSGMAPSRMDAFPAGRGADSTALYRRR